MRRFRPSLWPTVIAVPMFVTLIGLGLWQLERREWKQALIADLVARNAAPPLTLAAATADPNAATFRRIRLEGTFLHDRAMLLIGRSWRGATGFGVITPLVTADGRAVLVDRGWIPSAGEPVLATAPEPASLEAVIRQASGKGAPIEGGNRWVGIDIAAMAAAARLDPQRVVPFYVAALPSDDPTARPVAEAARIDLPNNHLQYALTWFALAAALIVIYVLFHLRRDRPEA